MLIEADFNMRKKVLFSKRVLAAAREACVVPDNHYSNKGKTKEDGNFANGLMCNLSRQRR